MRWPDNKGLKYSPSCWSDSMQCHNAFVFKTHRLFISSLRWKCVSLRRLQEDMLLGITFPSNVHTQILQKKPRFPPAHGRHAGNMESSWLQCATSFRAKPYLVPIVLLPVVGCCDHYTSDSFELLNSIGLKKKRRSGDLPKHSAAGRRMVCY